MKLVVRGSLTLLMALLLSVERIHCLTPSQQYVTDRRQALLSSGGVVVAAMALWPSVGIAEEEIYKYEDRNRNSNKQALIREDFWYMSGKAPPRKLEASLGRSFNDPKWNSFGACETSESTGNSCTYVSLRQKIPAYSKYAFIIQLGTREYGELGRELQQTSAWENDKTASLLSGPAEDALLKAILLATALLTSPNYSGPPRELLVARFYVNEVGFALREIRDALDAQDAPRARAAWEFGRDSWNSYFMVVNRAIVPKVGDQFEMIA